MSYQNLEETPDTLVLLESARIETKLAQQRPQQIQQRPQQMQQIRQQMQQMQQ